MDRVGGSIGWAGSGSVDQRVAERVGDGALDHAGDGDDVARLGLVDRDALEAAEAQHLGDAALLDQVAVGASTLKAWFGLTVPDVMRPVRMRPRKGLASRIVPSMRNGPSSTTRRRHMLEHEVEQRREVGPSARPGSSAIQPCLAEP